MGVTLHLNYDHMLADIFLSATPFANAAGVIDLICNRAGNRPARERLAQDQYAGIIRRNCWRLSFASPVAHW
jgi:hypothetical protein